MGLYKIIKNEAIVSDKPDSGITKLGLKIGDTVEGVFKIASNAILCKVGENIEPIYSWNLERANAPDKNP